MAEKVTKPEAAAKTDATANINAEAVYTVDEFARNATKLAEKANADIVYAAFMVEKKKKATLSEAKDIVSKFLNKEVK